MAHQAGLRLKPSHGHRGNSQRQGAPRAGARALGLAAPADDSLFVIDVASDGPAARAGLCVGDVLLGAAAPPPVSGLRLERYVARARPGSTVRLLVLRKGQRIEIAVTVVTRPTVPAAGR